MWQYDLFEFYRFVLAILAGTYTVVRTVTLLVRWIGPSGQAQVGSPMLYQYAVVLLLRTPIRRFLYDLAMIGALLVAFVLVIRLH